MGGKRGQGLGILGRVLALCAGWVAVIVVAAGREPVESPLLGIDDVGVVVYIVLALLALTGLAIIVYTLIGDRPEFTEPERKSRRFLLMLVALALFGLIVWQCDPDEGSLVLPEIEVNVDTGAGGAPREAREQLAEPVAETTDVLLVLLAAAVVGGLWYAARRKVRSSSPQQSSRDDAQADLAAALDNATAQLVTTYDPRTAVLLAYASLEQVLADRELERRPSETRTEHLRRSLAHISVDATPLIELAALYELARFSHNEISADDQQSALTALRRARDELTVTP